MRAGDWRDALWVGIAGLVLIVTADALVQDQREARGDMLVYELMAADPLAEHTFPFAYRLAVPTIVHLLPFGHELSFSLVAWISTAACGSVAYVLTRRFGAGRPLAAALALCLVVSPPLLVASLRQGRSVDPESVLVMLAGGLAIAERRPLALAIVVLAGAFVRESALFLVPFAYAVWAVRPLDPGAARSALAAGLPGLAAYAALRLGAPTIGRDHVPGYGSALSGRWEVVRDTLSTPFTALRRVAYAYGPLWLVSPVALRDLPYARRGLVLVALCAVAMTFAMDWGRIVLLAAPVFYAAGAHVLARSRTAAIATVAAFAAISLGYAVYMHTTGIHNVRNEPLPAYPVR